MTTPQDSWTDDSAYEAYVGRWSRRVGEGFLRWLDPFEQARWLDFGCGTGALTSQILASCAPRQIIGIEPSEEFLASARRQIVDARVRFQQGSDDRIPVNDGEIDFAVSGLVLNFVSDQKKVIKALLRTLNPGGTLAAYVWDYAGHVQFMRHFWDVAVELNPEARDKDEGVCFPLCRPGPLHALFESSGLRDVDVTAMDITTPFSDFSDYWTPFLSDVAPAPGYCASLDEESRTRLESRLRERLPTDSDGRILLAARAWAVKGTGQ
ncbi:class I SAM-dependent methyltransferase [Granulosicoccus sp. 3-233]|uniref:class I SAM-dependent methyltransferase n=1 Tax=Granulosicoccus sp. 3-233 TaxID=3417969 RepID=UPI003D33852E